MSHVGQHRDRHKERDTETELRSGPLAELWHKLSISESSFETGIQIQSCYTTHVEKQKTLEICARFLEQTLQPNPKRFWRQTQTQRDREKHMMHEVCCVYTHTLREEGLQNRNFENHLLLLLSNESLSSQHM
jgi:hypothetical protein